MNRYAAPLSVVVCVLLVFVATEAASGQYLTVEPMSLATNLGSPGGFQFSGAGRSDAASGAVIDRLPAKFLDELEAGTVPATTARRLDAQSVDRVQENWIVVIMLGVSFSFGLVVTVSMMRRAMVNQVPDRIF
jgi:hypothetical protein